LSAGCPLIASLENPWVRTASLFMSTIRPSRSTTLVTDTGLGRHFRKRTDSRRTLPPSKDLPSFLERLEQVREGSDRLRRPKEQDSVGFESIMKNRQELLLQLGVQIDQQVATSEQVQSRKRRILDHVLRSKDDHLADLLADPV